MRVFSDRATNKDVQISLPEILEVALENSSIVRVFSGGAVYASNNTFYDIGVSEQNMKAALAAFDATLQAGIYSTRIHNPPNSFFGPGLSNPTLRDEGAFTTGLVKPLVTGGQASILYNPSPGYFYIPGYSGTSYNPSHIGQLDFLIRQPLLNGAGSAVNLAPIRISQISVEQSAWDFKKAAMASVRSIIEVYWDLYAAHVELQSIDTVIPLLEELVRLQEEGFKAEWVIKADVAKAYAELYLYRQRRLEAISAIVELELRLRHLMNLPPADGRNLIPVTPPTNVLVENDPQTAFREAMANQPDLVKRRLDIRIRELELLVAENKQLPNLDFQALYRMNGIGQDVGSQLEQLFSAQYTDYLLGMNFSVPLGRRQGTAAVRAANLSLSRDRAFLQQTSLTIAHELGNELQRINYAYGEYKEAEKRLRAADDWLQGSRLRYQNPNPEFGEGNWLLQSLNDYLSALDFRTQAATDQARVLAAYNTELARLEETKGTILSFFAIEYVCDPCQQSRILRIQPEENIPPLHLKTPATPTNPPANPGMTPEVLPAPQANESQPADNQPPSPAADPEGSAPTNSQLPGLTPETSQPLPEYPRTQQSLPAAPASTETLPNYPHTQNYPSTESSSPFTSPNGQAPLVGPNIPEAVPNYPHTQRYPRTDTVSPLTSPSEQSLPVGAGDAESVPNYPHTQSEQYLPFDSGTAEPVPNYPHTQTVAPTASPQVSDSVPFGRVITNPVGNYPSTQSLLPGNQPQSDGFLPFREITEPIGTNQVTE